MLPLLQVSLTSVGLSNADKFSPASMMRVYKRKILTAPAQGLVEYRVSVDVAPLLDIARQGLHNTSTPASHSNRQSSNVAVASSHPADMLPTTISPVRVSVLGPVLERVLPALVESFNTKEATKHRYKGTKDSALVKRSAPQPKALPVADDHTTSLSATQSENHNVRLRICSQVELLLMVNSSAHLWRRFRRKGRNN